VDRTAQRALPPETASLVREFLALNRRRTRGDPPLGVEELERWMELRPLLEEALGCVGRDPRRTRRRALRVPTHLKVRFRHGAVGGLGRARDVSEGGLFLVTDRPLAPGTPLHLELEAAGRQVEVEGVVVWLRESEGATGPPGMGVRFDNLDESERRAVAELVENALADLQHLR
jgi:uncharacterized protein (TIGR02266 family)